VRDGCAALYALIAWCSEKIVGILEDVFPLDKVTTVNCLISDKESAILCFKVINMYMERK
jgi:hypothetical protein